MRKARLIHNANAGEGKYAEDELIALLTDNGYTVSYANAKKGNWDKWNEEDDLIIVAGGDGTVRKVVKKLVKRALIDKRFPVAVFPLGTANNIASTLSSSLDPGDVIAKWKTDTTRPFDIARVRGVAEENFFMEGLGVGVFPQLMKEMSEREDEQDPKAELQTAQKLFGNLVSKLEPQFCKLIIDGEDHSGEYILVEIMNIQAVGPNLDLAPTADPSDGLLDIVMITAEEQEKLAAYVRKKAADNEERYHFNTVRGKDIRMEWPGGCMHVDDQLINLEKNTAVHIQLEPGLLVFVADATQNIYADK